MIKGISILTISILLSLFLFPPILYALEEPIPVIAVFKDAPDVQLFQNYGGEVIRVFKIIPGIHGLIKPTDLEKLRKDPKIKYVEIDEKIPILQEIQWNLQQIRAPEAWSIGNSYGYHPLIQVAVLDTGVDCTHEDLAANIVWTPSADPAFPSACPDTAGHGTHVAGIVAALLNGIGVAGVAPQVQVYAILVCPGGTCPISDIVQGIQLALEGPDGILDSDNDGIVAGDPEDADGAEVMNMSFGGPGPYPAIEDAIQNAYNYGVISVASAGNSGCPDGDTVLEPARYPTTIAVSATTSADTIASFSSCGPSVDVAAPGENVLSTLPGNQYGELSGTSMSAPHVVGTIALMQAVRVINNLPVLKPEEVRTILHQTADDYPPEGFDIYSGYGRIRADRAVEAALAYGIVRITKTATLPPSFIFKTSSTTIPTTANLTIETFATKTTAITTTSIEFITLTTTLYSTTQMIIQQPDINMLLLIGIIGFLVGSGIGLTFVRRGRET